MQRHVDVINRWNREAAGAVARGEPGVDDTAILNGARLFCRLREQRKAFLPPDFVGEPVWDILLFLLISRLEGRSVSLTSAGQAANVPQTTAFRYLTLMEAEGLVTKTSDPLDARRQLVELTPSSRDAMAHYMATALIMMAELVETSEHAPPAP